MIKLTLNPDKESKIYTLDQEVIIIGQNQENVDIPLNSPDIQPRHVLIEEQNDRFIICNTANDPFTSLNGLPFGKKTLKNFDKIEIGTYIIQFECIEEDQETLPKNEPQEDLFLNIESLMREVEELSISNTIEKPASVIEENSELEPTLQEECKDIVEEEEEDDQENSLSRKYYLQDFDDESELWSAEGKQNHSIESETKGNPADTWKMLGGLLFAIIALSTIIFGGVYFRASGKNSQEEKKIAAGIADISMAITHARLNHITPNKQNWSDPNFISNNLARVLSPNLHTQAQTDSDGRFIRYPYLLRVYTSRNMDKFIVIAQPAPNFMQWLVHKKTIVVDSTTMEMRKITDLKSINRLLANPNPLEGINGEDIHRLIKQGTLMSLNSLAGHKNHWGFSPPKALGYIRPGAENNIYNAPRYYPFGEELLRKAIQFYHNPGDSSDIAIIQDEMDEISNFNNIVLYTSEGLQTAVKAQKALNTFAPNSRSLVAYVKFNTKGFVASSHLLMNEEREEISFLDSPKNQLASLLDKTNESDQVFDSLSLDPEENSLFAIDQNISNEIDVNHPLYLQLKSVYTDRKRALKSLSRQMVELLNQQNNLLNPEFKENFLELANHYIRTDTQHQHKIIDKLGRLYQEYVDMPLEEFIKFIDKAKLTTFAHATLNEKKKSLEDQTDSQNEIEEHFQLILEAQSLNTLESLVTQTSQFLSLENLPDTQKLIHYQDLMHNHTLDRLTTLLLSADSPYHTKPFEESDRDPLIHILENAWISDSHEFDYFISEFDRIKKSSDLSKTIEYQQ